MKKGFIGLIISIGIFMGNFTFLYSQDNTMGEKETLKLEKEAIVVYPIKDNTGNNLGNVFTDDIINVLSTLGRFRVVDRAHLQQILKEQELALSGLVDLNSAVKVGNLVGAKKMITGSVNYVTVTPKTRKVKKEQSVKLLGVPVASAEKEVNEVYGYKSKVKLTLNFIDIATGEIVKTEQFVGNGEVKVVDKNLAIQKAVESVVKQIPDAIRKIFILKVVIPKVEDGEVYFPAGDNIGLKKGYRFRVYEFGTPIRDYKGNIIARRKKKVGEVKVSDVYPTAAMGRILYGNIKSGDMAEEWVVKEITASIVFGIIPFKLAKNITSYTLYDPAYSFSDPDTIKFTIDDDISYLYSIGIHGEYDNYEPFVWGFGIDVGFGHSFYAGIVSLGGGYKMRFGGKFSLTPSINIGVMPIFGDIGKVANPWDDFHSLDGDKIKDGSTMRVITVSFGITPQVTCQFNFTDTLSLRGNIGYNIYMSKEKWDVQAQREKDDEWVYIAKDLTSIGKLNLSGLYLNLGISWFF